MTRRRDNPLQREAWKLDQLTKSVFFHRKLHEWRLLEIAEAIDQVEGENLHWENLNISTDAWNKIIHRGIKPVLVFVHPHVLQTIPGAVGYYRMLAMVSQKSMKRVGINTDTYEATRIVPDQTVAYEIAEHLNHIISTLVETDTMVNAREFDLWRGMAAGAQAQGSWQNNKGTLAETAIEEILRRRLQEKGYVTGEEVSRSEIHLDQDRVMLFSDEPDIGIYQNNIPLLAIEIKGGIDPAGVLERIGAALKSLRRIRQENPESVTILILQDVSITERARTDLSINTEIVTHLFSARAIVEDESEREAFFQILGI